ncbi:MAG: hypothetical protein LBR29_10650, partial [Methylobacteriaceae bacterium]|nr:hypothetical protein [Methylobacteriaceae bacterium]
FTTPRNILINTHNSYSCIEFVKAGLGFSIVPSISVPEDERLFTMPILNIKGEPYLRPTRLLFYNKVRNLDVYNVFIEFFQSKMINAKVA